MLNRLQQITTFLPFNHLYFCCLGSGHTGIWAPLWAGSIAKALYKASAVQEIACFAVEFSCYSSDSPNSTSLSAVDSSAINKNSNYTLYLGYVCAYHTKKNPYFKCKLEILRNPVSNATVLHVNTWGTPNFGCSQIPVCKCSLGD